MKDLQITLGTKIDKKKKNLWIIEIESYRVLDEANRGEEAWHEAHKERNKLKHKPSDEQSWQKNKNRWYTQR